MDSNGGWYSFFGVIGTPHVDPLLAEAILIKNTKIVFKLHYYGVRKEKTYYYYNN